MHLFTITFKPGEVHYLLWGGSNNNNISLSSALGGWFTMIYMIVGIFLVAPVSTVVSSNKKWKTQFELT